MRYIIALMLVFTASMLFVSCDQMQEKQNEKQGDQMTPETSSDKLEEKSPHEMNSEGDAQADRLMKEADTEYTAYKETPNDDTKSATVKKSMDAAMYLMYDAQLPPRDKYKPALKYFRIVLKLDPGNEEAKVNKEKIEEIYESMGKPIPETEI
jgi:hypothetical protein